MNPTEIVSVKLGYLNLEEIHDKDRVQCWVQERAAQLNIDLNVYEIHIDQINGCVTTKMKKAWTIPEPVRAIIKYDN